MAFSTLAIQAQNPETGTIAGKLVDKEMQGEPLPFANVLLKGSTKGATTDMDGLYSLDNLEPGIYTIVFSFLGYETLEVPNVEVVANKVTEVNSELGSSAASLDEVVINTVSRRDSEVALLLEQKRAIDIKESIGAKQLSKMGVSDVATATSKISGVTTSEASGDLFVRGLGDRYLYTTFNGLPVPSDDVERKNIDLGLFSTSVIQNVSISKTYSAENSADQASGTIDITSRELAGKKEFELGLDAGINTNVIGQFKSFKVSTNQKDVTAGFYSQKMSTESALNNQAWDPQINDFPVNRGYSLTAGTNIGGKARLLFTGSRDISFEYNEGTFREFRSNNLYDLFSDVEIFRKTENITALLDLGYRLNDRNRIKVTSLFINKLTDEVYESGRNAEGVVFEETSPSENLNQFVRDQNIKQTRLWVNQLHGSHDLSERNELEWALGYNLVNADEPNRIRNEVNIDGEGFVQLGRMGGFQQRKSSQRIDDTEINAFLQDKITFLKEHEDNKDVFLLLGANFRNKQRDFISRFFGVTESSFNTIHPPSIDQLSEVFTTENFQNGKLRIRRLSPDVYDARLQSYSGFANLNFGFGKWNFNAGARYQVDELDVNFDVNNYPSTLPQFTNKDYDNIYPSLNLKYSYTENSNFRLAVSRTITIPEFKEIAPFEYVSQTGQITRGNPDLEASTNFNLDLKYEFFPSAGELISLTGFFKEIKDPINRVQDRGAAGVFSFFNAGEKANVFGIELGTNVDIIKNEDSQGIELQAGLNATRMWHEQDLKNVYRDGRFIRTFQYNGKSSVGLQGASDWIFNGSINLSTQSSNPFQATLVANYASDKIYALGAPEVQTQTAVFYNDEIIEKGFVTLDLVLNQKFGEHWDLQLSGKNLLNPEVKRVQNIRPSTTGVENAETVRSYTSGTVLSLGINYSF
ncbi:TonB-dependent receptor [Salinimicrobium sp. CDJ15-91]|uniref:TonB-dependent receptor n=2 Tax=Salinimicrobium oceani TaxID=2722702 RepID=A0ABX1D075_9FLAO|nr:TonB-dependent receptor [Salinimicrobium oceani]